MEVNLLDPSKPTTITFTDKMMTVSSAVFSGMGTSSVCSFYVLDVAPLIGLLDQQNMLEQLRTSFLKLVPIIR